MLSQNKIRNLSIAILLVASYSLSNDRLNVAEAQSQACRVVTQLPITINTPGKWCVDRWLNSTVLNGPAIRITSSWVDLDLNSQSILSRVGAPSNVGVQIEANNVRVHNGSLLGFGIGVWGTLGESSRSELNNIEVSEVRIVSSWRLGILTSRVNNAVIRNNQISRVGQNSSTYSAGGISISVGQFAQVEGNTISGVWTESGRDGHGVQLSQVEGSTITNNTILNVTTGILVKNGSDAVVANNNLINSKRFQAEVEPSEKVGVLAKRLGTAVLRDNTIVGYQTSVQGGVVNAGGNKFR